MNERHQHLVTVARERWPVSDPGHDFTHALRVAETCRRIGPSVGADLVVLIAAALLHDMVNLAKDDPERLSAGRRAAEASRPLLAVAGYDAAEINRIAVAIEEHGYSQGAKPTSLESAVLQDADRLDAIGAIGLLRMITCGCRLGASYYDEEDPFAESRAPDDRRFMIDHLHVKLFRLVEGFHTAEGREEARRRVAFLRTFIEQLRSEIRTVRHSLEGASYSSASSSSSGS